MYKILIVDNDKDFNNAACDYLMQNGFDVEGCNSTGSAYNALYDGIFDLIVSDISVPEDGGFDFAKNIRLQNADIPIIFVSEKDDIKTKRKAFLTGADNFIVKPVLLEELLLRINALFRRAKIAESKEIKIGKLVLNADERSAVYGDEAIALTTREFNIIYKMLSNPKITFSRTQLMNEFWNADSKSGTRTVDVYMTKLRDKFAKCKEIEIQTVHGVGYKLVIKQ